MENGHVLDALDDRNGPIFLKCMIIFALAFLADNLIKLHPRSDFCHRISKHAISISRKYIEHVLAFYFLNTPIKCWYMPVRGVICQILYDWYLHDQVFIREFKHNKKVTYLYSPLFLGLNIMYKSRQNLFRL